RTEDSGCTSGDASPSDAAGRLPSRGLEISMQGAAFDAVAIGASAGGVTALQTVISALPRGFRAAVLIVQHLDPRHKSLLADLLGRHAQMTVKEADDDEPIRPGTVYIAPPDNHLLVAKGHVS